MEKKCYKCGEIKDLSEFGKNKSKKDGLRAECKICHCKMSKEYITKNSDIVKERSKKYREENTEKIKERKKEYYYNGGGKEKSKEWSIENIETVRIKRNENEKNKRKTEPLYKLKGNIRNLINKSFTWKGLQKNSKTENMLGCSFDEFRIYLESKFEHWMSWENHGICNGKIDETWNVDHIIPLDTAQTEKEIIKLSHYTNLQPLCSYVNQIIKRNKQ